MALTLDWDSQTKSRNWWAHGWELSSHWMSSMCQPNLENILAHPWHREIYVNFPTNIRVVLQDYLWLFNGLFSQIHSIHLLTVFRRMVISVCLASCTESWQMMLCKSETLFRNQTLKSLLGHAIYKADSSQQKPGHCFVLFYWEWSNEIKGT